MEWGQGLEKGAHLTFDLDLHKVGKVPCPLHRLPDGLWAGPGDPVALQSITQAGEQPLTLSCPQDVVPILNREPGRILRVGEEGKQRAHAVPVHSLAAMSPRAPRAESKSL